MRVWADRGHGLVYWETEATGIKGEGWYVLAETAEHPPGGPIWRYEKHETPPKNELEARSLVFGLRIAENFIREMEL